MEEVALASVAIVASQINVKGDLRIFEALGGFGSQRFRPGFKIFQV